MNTIGITSALACGAIIASPLVAAPRSSPGLVDLRTLYPWLPEKPAAITPDMARKMEAFTRAYASGEVRPVGKGVKAADVEALAADIAKLGLHRDASGKAVCDAPMIYNGEHGLPKGAPAGAIDFMAAPRLLVKRLRNLYAASKPGTPETARLEELARLVLEYLAERPWNPTDTRDMWVGNGYTILHQSPGHDLLGLARLLPSEAMRAQLAENVWWMFDGSCTLVKSPGLSTDSLRNTIPQVFAGVAGLPDGPEKYQRILTLRRALDTSTIDNAYNLVAPDGSVIHHGGHHDRYASYSFGPLTEIYTKLAASGFPGEHAAEINRRFRLAAEVWARTTIGDEVIPSIRQRVVLPFAGTNRKLPRPARVDFAVAAAKLAAVSGGTPPESDRDLAGLILAVDPKAAPASWRDAWSKAGYTAVAPTGAVSLPGAGSQIQTGDGWTVALRGQNKHLRGGEGTGGGYRYTQWGQQSSYGERWCRGSLYIVDTGTPPDSADSGWIADGFDYSRVPGTTGPVMDAKDMVGSYYGTGAKLGGGVSLDGVGLWIFSDGVRKSAFLTGEHITMVNAGVAPVKSGVVRTTVFQSAEDRPAPLSVDGEPVAATLVTTLPGGAPHTLLDARGRGYYLHGGGDALELRRGEQQWLLCDGRFFDPQADPAVGVVDDGYRTAVFRKDGKPFAAGMINGAGKARQIEGPAKMKYFRPSTGRFSTLGYAHDATTRPDRPDIFTLIPKCDAARLAAFASAMKSAKPPVAVKTAVKAHAFRDEKTGFSGTSLFEPGDIPASLVSGDILASSRAGTLLEHRTAAGTLRIAVASTDIDDQKPFVIRIRGHRAAVAVDPEMKLEVSGEDTLLTVPCPDMRGRIAEVR